MPLQVGDSRTAPDQRKFPHFQFQVKYNTGWETVEDWNKGSYPIQYLWSGFKRRYSSLYTRLLKDGKPVRYG